MILTRYTIFLLILSSYTVWAQAPRRTQGSGGRRGSQVLDDSTRNVYGPKTTRWISEEDIYYDRKNYQVIDTSIHNYHRWGYAQRFNYKYKDLGYIGTALFPIFPQLPGSIGVSTGFNAYSPYFLSEEPKYFDTKSPYTRLQIIWGGFGRAMTKVEFSRNITPRWNFGFNYRPLLLDKQIQRTRKGDRQTVSHYYDFYTAYKSKNDKYQMLINYRRIKHSVFESGGVFTADLAGDSTYKSLFEKDIRPRLSKAQAIHQRNQVHLLQQYRLGRSMQVYHISDLGKEINTYSDEVSTAPEGYYDNFVTYENGGAIPIARDSTHFSYWANSLGLKGRSGKFFYDAYAKIRTYDFKYKDIGEDTLNTMLKDIEYYMGYRLSYDLDSLTRLKAWYEYLAGGKYKVQFDVSSKWVDLKANYVISRPSFIQNAYRGSFDLWNNDFSNTITTQVEAFGKFELGRFLISPGATYTSLQNFIFFEKGTFLDTEQTVLPIQSAGKQELLSPEIRFDFRFFRHFHLRPQIIYSVLLTNSDNGLRIPEIFTTTQLAYENNIFKNHLQVQIGIDVNWRSEYFDLGYDPTIQQFYNQSDVLTPAFPLTEVFLNGKMKTGRFFFKYHNLVQAFTKSGYLPTPVYPGQRNIFDFGFELLLFD